MEIELSEVQLIYILNSINVTLRFMKYHNSNEKGVISNYFNYHNYDIDYNNLILIHRLLSTLGNKVYYNEINEFFIGQKNYLIRKEKDFEFLFEKKEFNIKVKEELIKPNKIFDFKNKFSFFRKSIGKLNKVV